MQFPNFVDDTSAAVPYRTALKNMLAVYLKIRCRCYCCDALIDGQYLKLMQLLAVAN